MNIQSLPKFQRPQTLTSLESTMDNLHAEEVIDVVTKAFDLTAKDLAKIDNTRDDMNPEEGEVLLVDLYQEKMEPVVSTSDWPYFEAAQLNFDAETGQVKTFTYVEDAENNYKYEVKDDGLHFSYLADGRASEAVLNAQTGTLLHFEGHSPY